MLALIFILAAPATQPASAPSTAPVVVRDETVFTFRAPRGEVTPADRATRAANAIDHAIGDAGDVSVVRLDDEATFYVADKPLFVLTLGDAKAEGDETLDPLIERRHAEVDNVLHAARRRASLQKLFLSISLAVSLCFFAVLLLRQLTRLGRRARDYIDSPELVQGRPLLRRLLEDERLRWLFVLLGYGAQVVLQIGVVYLLLLGTFSLFATTLAWRARLSRLLYAPIAGIGKRIISGLPSLLLLILMLVILQSGMHAVSLAFDTAERRRRTLLGVRPTAMRPLRLLAQVLVLLGVFLLVTPFVTGASDHIFTRIGLVLLLLIGLAVVPLVANAAVGMWGTFAGRFIVGEHLTVGHARGTLEAVDFYGLRLRQSGAQSVVPHLVTLWSVVEKRAALAASLPGADETLVQLRAVAFAQAHGLSKPDVEVSLVDGKPFVHVTIADADPALRNDFLRTLLAT